MPVTLCRNSDFGLFFFNSEILKAFRKNFIKDFVSSRNLKEFGKSEITKGVKPSKITKA